MSTRRWGGSQAGNPECDSGALPAELQPLSNERNLHPFPAPVKGAKPRGFLGKKSSCDPRWSQVEKRGARSELRAGRRGRP